MDRIQFCYLNYKNVVLTQEMSAPDELAQSLSSPREALRSLTLDDLWTPAAADGSRI